MSRHEEKKKSIVFIIFGILLSIVLVAFTGVLIYQLYNCLLYTSDAADD